MTLRPCGFRTDGVRTADGQRTDGRRVDGGRTDGGRTDRGRTTYGGQWRKSPIRSLLSIVCGKIDAHWTGALFEKPMFFPIRLCKTVLKKRTREK